MWKSARIIRRSGATLALGVLAIALAGCGEEQAAEAERGQREIRIVPQRISLSRDTQRVEAVGTARANRSAIVTAETGGLVMAVNFTAGNRVEEGAVLLELDARTERLDVAQTEVAVRDAQALLDRYERIDVEGAISESQIDEARTALDAARIERDLARVALDDRSVTAPFAGHVGLTTIDPGARITTDTEITQLDDRSTLYVDFEAPEQVFGRISVGDEVQMEPFADPETSYPATVSAVDSRVSADTRSFTVRAVIDNASDVLRPGMSFRTSVELPGPAYPAVPEAAIVWGGDGAYLWAVRDGRAARVSVTIVSRKEGRVLVKADLAEGDVIVAEGVQKVRQDTPLSFASEPGGAEPRPVSAVGGASSSGQP